MSESFTPSSRTFSSVRSRSVSSIAQCRRASLLRRAAGGITLDEKDLVARHVLRLAIGKLAGKDRNTRAAPLLDDLARLLARDGRADRELRDLLRFLDILVEPCIERILHTRGDELQRFARREPLLRLALELRIEDA